MRHKPYDNYIYQRAEEGKNAKKNIYLRDCLLENNLY